MENTIVCPGCQRTSRVPLFHCPRCGRDLVQDVSTEGPQIVIRFHGEMARSVAVFYQHQPVRLRLVDITGPTVLLVLEGEVSLPQPASTLYSVLNKGEELWELQGPTG